ADRVENHVDGEAPAFRVKQSRSACKQQRELHFFTYFFTFLGPTSAPKTLPCASAVTPSAALVTAAPGDGSGMNAATDPSRALPMRIPRFQPGCGAYVPPSADSESATYRLSPASMKTPLGRLNCFHSSMNLPS